MLCLGSSLGVVFGLIFLISATVSSQEQSKTPEEERNAAINRIASQLRDAIVSEPSDRSARDNEIREKLNFNMDLLYDSPPFGDVAKPT